MLAGPSQCYWWPDPQQTQKYQGSLDDDLLFELFRGLKFSWMIKKRTGFLGYNLMLKGILHCIATLGPDLNLIVFQTTG